MSPDKANSQKEKSKDAIADQFERFIEACKALDVTDTSAIADEITSALVDAGVLFEVTPVVA